MSELIQNCEIKFPAFDVGGNVIELTQEVQLIYPRGTRQYTLRNPTVEMIGEPMRRLRNGDIVTWNMEKSK